MSSSYTPSRLSKYGIVVGIALVTLYFVVDNEWMGLTTTESDSNRIVPDSIWVLPFVYVGDYEDGYLLGEGLSESVNDRLVRYEGLLILSVIIESPGTYPETHEEIDSSHIRANYIVEGSVQIVDDQIHVTARLFDVKLGSYRWRNMYTGSLAGYFEGDSSIESTIAQDIHSSVKE